MAIRSLSIAPQFSSLHMVVSDHTSNQTTTINKFLREKDFKSYNWVKQEGDYHLSGYWEIPDTKSTFRYVDVKDSLDSDVQNIAQKYDYNLITKAPDESFGAFVSRAVKENASLAKSSDSLKETLCYHFPKAMLEFYDWAVAKDTNDTQLRSQHYQDSFSSQQDTSILRGRSREQIEEKAKNTTLPYEMQA